MRILVVTGASGGHIFPTLGFLDTLKTRNEDIQICLVLPRKNIKSRIENPDYKVNYISISPLKLNFDFKTFSAILKFFKGILESIFIMFKFRPDITVGFGTIVSVPVILMAWMLRIKTLIHEQNVIPGRANRFLAGFVDKIAISFKESKNYFKSQSRKIILTGNPLRPELKKYDKNEALEFFGFNQDKFTILVMGGSLGSHRINLGFLKAVSLIPNQQNLQIIHLSGSKDYSLLKASYRDLNLSLRLFSFLEKMQYAYSASDLVISRAGATTISEIIFYRMVSILIPYPFVYQHQLENARVLEKMGSAIIIEDSKLDTDRLRNTIEDFISHPDKIKVMSAYYDNFFWLDANNLLVDALS